MTVDLEALAHDLRLAGWDSFIADEAVFAIAHKGHIHQIQLLIDPWFGDGGSVFCESDGENATPVEVIAIIARHLGAGQPVDPPAPLSAEEFSHCSMQLAIASQIPGAIAGTGVRAVLAALPARYAVRREGA